MAEGRISNKELNEIVAKIREVRNFDFHNYKMATLRRRIERRMAERKTANARSYLALISRDPREVNALVSTILIKVTSFFRDPETWELLGEKILPEIIRQKKHGDELRVWCAGCATGEEAYSLAILLNEVLGSSVNNYDVKVFASDADEDATAFARRGEYSIQQLLGVSPTRLNKWFTPSPEGYTIRKELRRFVVFGVNNLVKDAPISRLDLLLCRNVFIYLDSVVQTRVLRRFHYALRQQGVLVLGRAELLPSAERVFEPISIARRIYKKDSRASADTTSDRMLEMADRELRALRPVGIDFPVSLDQLPFDVANSLDMPIIATELDGSIKFWNRAAEKLWGRSQAECIRKKLTTIGLEGLPGELLVEKTNAVREGKSESENAQGVIVRRGDSAPRNIAVTVAPLSGTDHKIEGLLYLVTDITPYRRLEEDLKQANEARERTYAELSEVNEELQSTNEELETTNEELQSSNEELQTTNEELQSTNEELETTNEELQSTNAELDAANRELSYRTDELNTLSFYLRTIIRTLSAAVIVLDNKGGVTFWNLAAERLFGIAEEVALGQSIWNMHIATLRPALLLRLRRSLTKRVALRTRDSLLSRDGQPQGKATITAMPLVDNEKALGSVIMVEEMISATPRAERSSREEERAADESASK